MEVWLLSGLSAHMLPMMMEGTEVKRKTLVQWPVPSVYTGERSGVKK